MKSLRFLITIQLLASSLAVFWLSGNANAVNTVGRPCTNDTDCTGLNEYCHVSTTVDPPCVEGTCACKRCHMLDPVIGNCEPTLYKTLNDLCNDSEMGHTVLPRHAQCRSGIVLCRRHHAFIEGSCIRIEINGDYGQPCGPNHPCDEGLECSIRFSICTCPDRSKRWDPEIDECVPRGVGDYCEYDDECMAQTTGFVLNPITGPMACVSGTCQCSAGSVQSSASFIMTRTNMLLTKPICQNPTSSNGIDFNGKCSIGVQRPGTPINVCNLAYTCHQCPEDSRRADYTNFDGVCRAALTPEIKPLCPGQIPEKGRRSVPKVGSFGNKCSSNAECVGPNEICLKTLNIDPPCLKGICGCMSGFVVNIEAGYLCVIVVRREVGQQCNAEAETPGVVYPTGAICNNGTIECTARHTVGPLGNCQRSEAAGWIDAPCNSDGDCEGDLRCVNGRCGCTSAYKWIALGTGRCAPKEIGDACEEDADCASASSGGADSLCIDHMCGCPQNTILRVANDFDPKADNFIVVKYACIVPGPRNNQSSGEYCNLDKSSMLCAEPLVCYKCEEDQFDIGQGICRQVRATAVITNTVAPVIASAIKRYNSVGKICRRNSDCMRNEMCKVSRFIDPPCQTGLCVCRPCYSISAQSSQCELATYHIVGDSCTVGERGTFFPPNSECNNGVVLCKRHYSTSPTGGCVRSQLNGYFGAPCRTRADCDNGLTCGYLSKKCACPSSYMKWNPVTESCIKREFGDPCQADGDCAVHGNMREGFTYYGGACSAEDGQCVCARNYIQTSASFVDLILGQYSRRTICVANPSIVNVARGGTCQTDPVYSSDSRIYVCSAETICFHCPEDRSSLSTASNSNIGKCRTLIDVPPSPQCFPWLPTTVNRTTTTTPAPPTFRIITTTPTTTVATTKRIPVAKIVRVDTVCSEDTECGYNEYCWKAEVAPPCAKGVCKCKPCHAQDDTSRLCSPKMQLFLGEGCSYSALEVYPDNAMCKMGLVTCKSCFQQVGNDCVKMGRTPIGSSCNSVCECDGNMFCNRERKVCECFHAFQKWDSEKRLCVRREFGDACTSNVECDVFGSQNSGYTYSGGLCVSSRCACDEGYIRVVTGFIANEVTGEMGEKAICVVNTSLQFTNRNLGERCNLDPIWFSGELDALTSGVCRSQQTCFQCPDDRAQAGNDGQCRTATPKTTESVCTYKRPSKALPLPTPPATPLLTNTVGLPCSRDTECSTNEECVIAQLDPACKKGLCACKSCHAIGVQGSCTQYIQLNCGDYCDDVPNEIYPANTSCQLGVVTCNPCYLPQAGNKCVRATALRPYGARCISDCDCSGTGTYCEPDSGTCMCRQYYEKWDAVTERCLRREFGDQCINDAQCQVRGQNARGYTYSGGACVGGQCVCGSRYTRTTTSFYVDKSTNALVSKTLCIRDGIEVNRTQGQACDTDPIYNSDDAEASLGSCRTGFFCYQCPDDLDLPNFRRTDGICRQTDTTTSSLRALAPIAPQDCFATYRNQSLTARPFTPGRFTTPLPPRIAGGNYVCSSQGFIMDMLLEHAENQPFASFQLTIMRQCNSVAECGSNENCVVPETMALGFCACKPPNFIGVDGACHPVSSIPTASTRKPTTWVRIKIGG